MMWGSDHELSSLEDQCLSPKRVTLYSEIFNFNGNGSQRRMRIGAFYSFFAPVPSEQGIDAQLKRHAEKRLDHKTEAGLSLT